MSPRRGISEVFIAEISESSGKEDKKMEAYVLMDADPGSIWEVAESALKIKE